MNYPSITKKEMEEAIRSALAPKGPVGWLRRMFLGHDERLASEATAAILELQRGKIEAWGARPSPSGRIAELLALDSLSPEEKRELEELTSSPGRVIVLGGKR